ncbi:MAG: PHP domain-containing protein [Clostridia bacterium]|nr:PHP domain-containing protein [Clostridia bacterium]
MDAIARLNAPTRQQRLEALAELLAEEKAGKRPKPVSTGFVNNHIHTTYSFSPYSPTAALWFARAAGLETAGIMDHDSVGGVEEFLAAAELCGMEVTCGFEQRVSLAGTPFEKLLVNNPDQKGCIYLACHGIPRNRIAEAEAYLAPYRAARGERNRKMTENLNVLLAPADICLDYERDVVSLSRAAEGGSVTERHLLYAVSLKLIERLGKKGEILTFLSEKLGVACPAKLVAPLSDENNPHYAYDLLGLLKSNLVEKFYIPATDELPHVSEFVKFVNGLNAVSAYPYLGDVGDSVTGDKKAQKFEDDFLDDLFVFIKESGFRAVTYMPSRNTMTQLERLMDLCGRHNFFQISGEDNNQPRQSFICKALEKPEFRHLYTATWALIAHELAATREAGGGLFSEQAVKDYPVIADRVARFATQTMPKK